jgi:hypothetical protein
MAQQTVLNGYFAVRISITSRDKAFPRHPCPAIDHWPFSPFPVHGSISIYPIRTDTICHFTPLDRALHSGVPQRDLTMHVVAGYWKPAGESPHIFSSGIGSPQFNVLSE